MKDQTLGQAIIEATRFLKAARTLRQAKREIPTQCHNRTCLLSNVPLAKVCSNCGQPVQPAWQPNIEPASVRRASMDLTRKLADLRQGR